MFSKIFHMGLAVMLTTFIFAGVTWAAAQKRAGAGTVSAITMESRSVVVQIPHGRDSLTVGAEVPPDAVLRADGRAIDLGKIRPGDRVRITWSRHEQGLTAHEIIVLGKASR